ncbi:MULTISPECIES: DNA topoisomerase (ATP-hydrolyzing) subunit B [unclassified Fibrobacter]|uniref:DNA topoisomerase (ATP-hydrolyzing) subunit B n=1 Tax=unclassified Fibrobacter TaxID=2634177 RepID=UPI000D6C9818|nr:MULTISPECIES: DNA topoisomerase (ATP-hydrolyzing) subunit B [unclassified Fibrobacter]PWJ62770.1 DNA gyrase subunit B [Fibrobacter sp. UWR4]PZW63739.1 DNA gyrase subunit B [Fibrobacter sp. UWR1]
MSEEIEEVKKSEEDYSGSNITVLEGLEAVRVRPAMYIGSTDIRGLHHLVWEVVDNSVDEALAGFCTHIEIAILPGNGIRVTDNGRGIPTDIHPKEKVGTLEVVMTKLHAGGKFDSNSYKVSAGLHGVGVSCVNALSTKLIATVRRKGKVVTQTFSKGIPCGPQQEIGTCGEEEHGTTIEFYPDDTIFSETVYVYETLATRFRELAFLMSGLRLTLTDERDEAKPSETFCFPGGVSEFVRYVDEHRTPLFNEPIHLVLPDGQYPLEVAMWYNDGYQENFFSFVNNVNTYDGGTHVTGFKTALTRVISKFAQDMPKGKKDITITADDIREGLTAVIAIKVSQPQFEGQTKRKLGNSEIASYVASAFGAKLDEYFQENPAAVKVILDKVYFAAQAREAAHKARTLARRKNVLESGGLPGKLADCSSRDPKECEMFIVEGDSAGGSAKQGRKREFQAILPLRGKILNVEKASLHRVLDTEEIQNLVNAIGCGLGSECKLEKLRYHKIVIMTDADVDGSHIQTLLLTFFFRYMRPLIDNGHVYLAMPPLYKLKVGLKEQYLFDENEKDEAMAKLEDKKNVTITRFKGLGEMSPEQLFETTMDPERRFLKQCYVEDAVVADQIFSMLMGEDVEPRRKFIETNAYKVLDELDV